MTSKISVHWHNQEQTILMVIIEDNWSWTDMYQAIDEVNQNLDRVSHMVYTIMDFTKATSIPDHALSNIKRLNRSHHPNQDKTAVVGLEMYGQILINMFMQLYGAFAKGNDVRLVSTLAEAYLFLDIESNTTDET